MHFLFAAAFTLPTVDRVTQTRAVDGCTDACVCVLVVEFRADRGEWNIYGKSETNVMIPSLVSFVGKLLDAATCLWGRAARGARFSRFSLTEYLVNDLEKHELMLQHHLELTGHPRYHEQRYYFGFSEMILVHSLQIHDDQASMFSASTDCPTQSNWESSYAFSVGGVRVCGLAGGVGREVQGVRAEGEGGGPRRRTASSGQWHRDTAAARRTSPLI
ncbi:hypothetical protein EVAR_14814_1 [Eumeta japonica]|uniref:Uncharacterized protein n=1 Tax=Eumeta variegata TaxID=151549 RepID=A0A4C1TWL1_EUMVA|nr:hypothetical protein EVAR_14814_1 [Eumeta japonica]